MGKNYKKLMEVDIKERKVLLELPDIKCGIVDVEVKRVANELEVVREMLVNGKRATATKFGMSLHQVVGIYKKVHQRISNSYMRQSKPDGNTYFKDFKDRGLGSCKKEGCPSITFAGELCGRHRPKNYNRYNKKQTARLKAIHKKEIDVTKSSRPDAFEIPDVMYSEIVKFIVKTCFEKHVSLAGKYYGDGDNDLVDMAVKGGFVSTKPIKATLVKLGVEIGCVLRGLENRHMKRFDEEAVKWAVLYSDFAKEGKLKGDDIARV